MFCIKLAGIPIGIDNRYAYVRRLCAGYETSGRPAFTVRASEREIRAEQGGQAGPSRGYCESLCLYRQICRRLPFYDAFLMHASVVAVDGAAYAFAAPSGTGKTTHTRLWLQQFGSRAQVVNGDKPVFRFMDGALYACGTPWRGKEGLGRSAFWSRAPQTASVRWAGKKSAAAFSTSCCSPPASRNWTGCGLCWSGCLQARRFTCCNATGSRRPRSWPMKA